MDERLKELFIEEIKLQCQYAMSAHSALISAVQKGDTRTTFFYVHAFLSHVGNVSKLFWPIRSQSRARGEFLRNELGVSDSFLIKQRDPRNHLEHYDERLDDWASSSQRHNIADMNIMPRSAIQGIDPSDFMRNLDPTTLAFYFTDEDYDLHGFASEMEAIRQSTEAWLEKRDPWGRPLQ